MTVRALLGIVTVMLFAQPVAAETCPTPQAVQRGARVPASCPKPLPRKVEPYDPDRAKAGSRPGFIDLGNGTEVRIGGRAGTEYDVRR